MGSEDDMYDDNYGHADYFEHDGEGGVSKYIDSDADVHDDVDTSQLEAKTFTVMNEDDIRRCQEEDISSVCNVLSVSRVSAIILLVHFNWSVIKVHEEWFADEAKVRKAVGLFEKPVIVDKITDKERQKIACWICFDAYWSKEMFSTASCNHVFCRSCWEGYIGTSINDGPGCLMLRCPDPSCNAVVDQDMVNELVCQVIIRGKYSRYLFRSYIEDSKNIKWCPAPGCSSAIQFYAGSENCDVTCKCTYRFCWSCIEEAHRPVDCSTIAQWNLKNSHESENIAWILANSKPCPKCQRPIEKNHGCMHMTCSKPCHYEFCWICLGPWNGHSCNQYKLDGNYKEVEKKRKKAKKYIQKYAHYYERWVLNHKSMARALNDLKQMQSLHIKNLSTKLGQTETQLEFIKDAWLQIIECRRVLKWTYAYGYYLPEQELVKKDFFEYLQGEAENGLERLHKCAEKELQPFLDAETPSEDFSDFCQKLKGLTTVTGTYFENLVRALENGLSDVRSEGKRSKRKKGASSKETNSSKRRLMAHDSHGKRTIASIYY